MKKKLFAMMLASVMMIGSVAPTYAAESETDESLDENVVVEQDDAITDIYVSEAAEEVDSGTFEGGAWTLDSNGLLTISGNGYMENFDECSAPWYGYRDDIKTVYISSGVGSIGWSAFQDCSKLTTVTISTSGHSYFFVGGNAFEDCISLTNISLPQDTQSIGYEAFEGCTSLTNITIPDSVSEIGSNAFSGCSM